MYLEKRYFFFLGEGVLILTSVETNVEYVLLTDLREVKLKLIGQLVSLAGRAIFWLHIVFKKAVLSKYPKGTIFS